MNSPTSTALRVYLDEDVDVLLARLLTAHGIDCLTTLDAGNLAKSDEEQLAFSLGEARILITHNRIDFEKLAVDWWNVPRDHAGIVLSIRRSDSYVLLRHVLPVVQLFDQSGWINSVMYA